MFSPPSCQAGNMLSGCGRTGCSNAAGAANSKAEMRWGSTNTTEDDMYLSFGEGSRRRGGGGGGAGDRERSLSWVLLMDLPRRTVLLSLLTS